MNVSMDTTVLLDREAYKLDGVKKTENSNVQNEEVNTINEKILSWRDICKRIKR